MDDINGRLTFKFWRVDQKAVCVFFKSGNNLQYTTSTIIKFGIFCAVNGETLVIVYILNGYKCNCIIIILVKIFPISRP